PSTSSLPRPLPMRHRAQKPPGPQTLLNSHQTISDSEDRACKIARFPSIGHLFWTAGIVACLSPSLWTPSLKPQTHRGTFCLHLDFT
ncbi:hypothetical protein B0H17DRAFT_1071757, partial [Mycena rosella]